MVENSYGEVKDKEVTIHVFYKGIHRKDDNEITLPSLLGA